MNKIVPISGGKTYDIFEGPMPIIGHISGGQTYDTFEGPMPKMYHVILVKALHRDLS